MSDTLDVTMRWADRTVYEVDHSISIEAMQDYYRDRGYTTVAEQLPTMTPEEQARWAWGYLQHTNSQCDWTNLMESRVYRNRPHEILGAKEKKS